ncbi:unnamed protein product [Urochloa humidicola]
MADEWWSSGSVRTGDGASACSTVLATDHDAAAESAATSATSTDYFRSGFHADAAASPPPSFLADPPPHIVDWAQQAFMDGGRAAAGFSDALLQLLHGDDDDDAGRHFLLDEQHGVANGEAPVAPEATPSRSASQYADRGNIYSSYGDAPAAPMTAKPPFSQQHFSAGFFGSSPARDFGGVPSSVPPPVTTTKPLLLQALERKAAFMFHKEPAAAGQDACSASATRTSVGDSVPAAAVAKKPRMATLSPLPTFKVRKEKLGDRITALQQLVSPFGKTDTASVLHEAVEYIRFLHDQVASLSSPYLRCGRPVHQLQQKQVASF